jgi:DNA-binding NtrC family response regulator
MQRGSPLPTMSTKGFSKPASKSFRQRFANVYRVEEVRSILYLDALRGSVMTCILLVEDDPDVLILFKEVLLDGGYQVDTAETFREADDLLNSREYDLLVSEGRLPGGTGIMLAGKAQAKCIPVLIVTGYLPWLYERHPELDINAYMVLRKPVTPKVLLGAITNTIDE